MSTLSYSARLAVALNTFLETVAMLGVFNTVPQLIANPTVRETLAFYLTALNQPKYGGGL
jgi:hypothetical protein